MGVTKSIESNKEDLERREGEREGEEEQYTNYLRFGDVLIDAIPTQVIIYDNPLDKSHKYKIVFSSDSNKKTQSIGPAGLEEIINELIQKNKILKKSNIHDKISCVISQKSYISSFLT